jgi:hypothetical protein
MHNILVHEQESWTGLWPVAKRFEPELGNHGLVLILSFWVGWFRVVWRPIAPCRLLADRLVTASVDYACNSQHIKSVGFGG